MKKLLITLALLGIAISGCNAATQMVVSQQQSVQADFRSREAASNADAERSRSDAQQAQANAQAAQAMAEAQTAQSKAMADFATSATNAVERSVNQNKMLLGIAMLGVIGIAIYAITAMQKVASAATQQPQQTAALPPPQIILIAQREGLTPIHDGQRWLMLDDAGTVRKRQKLLTIDSNTID